MIRESVDVMGSGSGPSLNHTHDCQTENPDGEEQNNNIPSKKLQFVVYDEDKIYSRRKYVRRKKLRRFARLEQPSCQQDIDCKCNFNKCTDTPEHKETSIIQYDRSPDFGNFQLNPFGTLPDKLSPVASQALSFLASHGPGCQLVQAWFLKGIWDDCLVHLLVLYSVSFPWLFRSTVKGLSDHPSILPWKIRAIQATNELLRDEQRNVSDHAIVAVAMLASLERTSGNVSAMMKHAKGLEIILQQRKLKYGTLEDACPVARRAAEASVAMGKLLSFHASNILPMDDPTATVVHTEYLQHRLKASLFCMTRFAATLVCASGRSLLALLQRLDYMLGVCIEQAQMDPGTVRKHSKFSECGDILDDLWVSQGIFIHHKASDPMVPAVSKCSWVGAVGTLLWIFMVGLERTPDEVDAVKKQMMNWVNHPSVREMDEFPLQQIREWAEHACKMVHLGFR